MCPIGLEPQGELVASEVINRKLVKHAVVVLKRALVVENADCVVTSKNLAMGLQSAELRENNVRVPKLLRQRVCSW